MAAGRAEKEMPLQPGHDAPQALWGWRGWPRADRPHACGRADGRSQSPIITSVAEAGGGREGVRGRSSCTWRGCRSWRPPKPRYEGGVMYLEHPTRGHRVRGGRWTSWTRCPSRAGPPGPPGGDPKAGGRHGRPPRHRPSLGDRGGRGRHPHHGGQNARPPAFFCGVRTMNARGTCMRGGTPRPPLLRTSEMPSRHLGARGAPRGRGWLYLLNLKAMASTSSRGARWRWPWTSSPSPWTSSRTARWPCPWPSTSSRGA